MTPIALTNCRSFGPRFSFDWPQAHARISAPFFGRRDPPIDRGGQQVPLQVAAAIEHRRLTGIEHRAIRGGESELLKFLLEGEGPAEDGGLGVGTLERVGGAGHRTSVSG